MTVTTIYNDTTTNNRPLELLPRHTTSSGLSDPFWSSSKMAKAEFMSPLLQKPFEDSEAPKHVCKSLQPFVCWPWSSYCTWWDWAPDHISAFHEPSQSPTMHKMKSHKVFIHPFIYRFVLKTRWFCRFASHLTHLFISDTAIHDCVEGHESWGNASRLRSQGTQITKYLRALLQNFCTLISKDTSKYPHSKNTGVCFDCFGSNTGMDRCQGAVSFHLIESIPNAIHSFLATEAFKDGAIDHSVHLHQVSRESSISTKSLSQWKHAKTEKKKSMQRHCQRCQVFQTFLQLCRRPGTLSPGLPKAFE